MDAVTYPHPEVAAEVSSKFEPVKISLAERHPDFREASGGMPVPWAPTFVFRSERGRELRRSVGWLGPDHFLAELWTARGYAAMTGRDFEAAVSLFDQAQDRSPTAPAAPEAGYWHGVARFLAGKRDMAALKESWNALRARFPNTEWAQKAEVIDDWQGG